MTTPKEEPHLALFFKYWIVMSFHLCDEVSSLTRTLFHFLTNHSNNLLTDNIFPLH